MAAQKICHVLAGNGTLGGLEKHVVDLSAAQARRGLEVSVLTTEALSGHFDEQVNVVPVRLDRSRLDPRLKFEIRKYLKALRPDIVHAHANKSAATVGRLLQGMPLCSVATVQNIKKDQSMFRHFDGVIAASQMVADTLDVPATVIRNSIDRPNFELNAKAEALKPPFLGCGAPLLYAAGRFVDAKGYDFLLEALSQIPEANLWLVGDGPDWEVFEKMVSEHGLQERIWMPGFLAVDEVLGLMTMADLFVISSRREGGPYTLAEALRYRCPVVSTRVGYAPELLDDEQLCDEVSAFGVEMGLRRALDDFDAYKKAMEPIFDRADRELDVEVMVDQVLAVYRQVDQASASA